MIAAGLAALAALAGPVQDDARASVAPAPEPVITTVAPIPTAAGLLSAHPGLAQHDVYGTSRQGQDLQALRVGPVDAQDRPCVVVVVDPATPIDEGRAAALDLAARLLDRFELADPEDLAIRVDWWIVAEPLPDRAREDCLRAARVASGFVAGWDPSTQPVHAPAPWPLYDAESLALATALGRLPRTVALVVLNGDEDPFAGGRLARHGRDRLGLVTEVWDLADEREADGPARLVADLPTLEMGLPVTSTLGEDLWLVDVDLDARGHLPLAAPAVDLTWTSAEVIALAAARGDGPFAVVRHTERGARLPAPAPGTRTRLRFVVRVRSGTAPELLAHGARWGGARRAIALGR